MYRMQVPSPRVMSPGCMVGGLHADNFARRLMLKGAWRPPLKYPMYGFKRGWDEYGRGGCLECEVERDLRRGLRPREILEQWGRRGWYPGKEPLVGVFWDWLVGTGERLERRRWESREIREYKRERSVLGMGLREELRHFKKLGERGVRMMLEGIEWADERIENRAARVRRRY